MLKVVLIAVFIVIVAGQKDDPATHQMATYMKKQSCPAPTLTTLSGTPVHYDEAYNSINTNILENEHVIESYHSVIKKNIPERVVHAPGAGAFGYFEVTHDVSHIIDAKFLNKIGKKTPVACRFSLGFSSKGVSDIVRESRGHAFKFYTEEGNYDLTLLNQPIFAIKEPALFPSFAHILKRNPATNLADNNMLWDFASQRPESMNQLLRIMSHQGMPRSYRHMRGFGIHTNQVYNASGHSHFVRFYALPDAGEKYFNLKEATEIAKESDYYARDLYNSIAKGNYPSWSFKMQIIPYEDACDPKKGIFDVTREQYYEDYELHTIGKIYLNRNPVNDFAEIEQLAFSPGNLVKGMLGGPDKIFQARRFAYRVSAEHRLGGNFKKIPVNAPLAQHTYDREGVPPVNDEMLGGANYYPNSFHGPEPYMNNKKPKLIQVSVPSEANNGYQIVRFLTKTLNSVQRSELIEVVTQHTCYNEDIVKKRIVDVLTKIHKEFGQDLYKSLKKAKCMK